MLVPLERQVVDRHGPTRRSPLTLVTEDEAPPDVEIAIEAEPLVERPSVGGVLAPEGLQIALDRVDVAGRGVAEVAQVR